MAVYLIDYENVHDDGLSGVASLRKEDRVIIFISNSTKNISIERHIEICNSEADVEHIRVEKVGKNYLDFQLATKLGYLFGKGEKGPAFIVSKDCGFESVVDFWKTQGYEVKRVEKIDSATIPNKPQRTKKAATNNDNNVENAQAVKNSSEEALPESWIKKIGTAVKKENIQESEYSYIYKAMVSSKKQAEYEKQIKEYFAKDDKGLSIYNHTQAIFGEYKKTLKKQ